MPSLDKINFSYKPIRRCTNKLINVSARILLSLTQHALLYAANYHQQQLLHRLLKKNQDTVFGKTYHVSNIQKFQEFQQQIPLSKYEDFFDKWIVPQLK